LTAGKHFCLGASLSRLVFESLLTRVESIHLFGFPIRKPTIQLRPTGRDELTE
jgi:cytochrome P450